MSWPSSTSYSGMELGFDKEVPNDSNLCLMRGAPLFRSFWIEGGKAGGGREGREGGREGGGRGRRRREGGREGGEEGGRKGGR